MSQLKKVAQKLVVEAKLFRIHTTTAGNNYPVYDYRILNMNGKEIRLKSKSNNWLLLNISTVYSTWGVIYDDIEIGDKNGEVREIDCNGLQEIFEKFRTISQFKDWGDYDSKNQS